MDEIPGGSGPSDDATGQPRSSRPPDFPPPPMPRLPDWGAPQATTPFPLDLNRMMEMTFSLFRFRWRMFVGLSLLVMLPIWVLIAAVDALTGSTTTWMAQFTDLAREGFSGPLPEELWRSIGLNLIVGAIAGIGIYIATGALTDAAALTFAGRRATAIGSIRRSLGRLPTYVGIWLVAFLVQAGIITAGIFVGTTLFLVASNDGRIVAGPAVFLGLIVVVATIAAIMFVAIRWSMAVPVASVESTGPRVSLGRSWRLVSGSSWRVLGYVLLWALVLGLIGGLLAVIITFAINPVRMVGTTIVSIDPARLAITTFISGVISSALAPISAIAMTLLYLDLRFRHGEKVPVPGEQEAPPSQEEVG